MMKKCLSICYSAVLLTLVLLPLNVSAKTGLSEKLLLPGEKPVRVKFPGVEDYIEVRSLRQFPDGAEIAPSNTAPFQILCPDLTKIDVTPGESFACPETPDFQLVAEVDPPPPELLPEDFDRGRDFLSLLPEEKQAVTDAEKAIKAIEIKPEQKIYLLAHVYESLELYTEAAKLLMESSENINDPAMLRFLGEVYRKDERYREAYQSFAAALELARQTENLEEQAAAQHHSALLLKEFNEQDEFRKQAQKALELYLTLGYTEQIEALQKLLNEE